MHGMCRGPYQTSSPGVAGKTLIPGYVSGLYQLILCGSIDVDICVPQLKSHAPGFGGHAC